ncbi:MAG: hypothetical protein GY943_13580 [Chloroflexi bacterium]|nr:hypothetical protein [Chloroflexota bacterium]
MQKKRTLLLVILSITVLFIGQVVLAQDDDETAVPAPVGSPLHPTFPLLDQDGVNVLDSGEPVSTMNTCGGCHDAAFIAEHSFHADVGLSEFGAAGSVENGRVWDSSTGYFGRWNPFTYRYLSPEGDDRIDLTTPEWLMQLGARHVGGGPAVYGRDGTPLVELAVIANDPETNIVDPATGELVPWDWQESGVVEMNCFLCHTVNPNNQARVETLQSGAFKWANTATLLGTGIVEQVDDSWQWQETAFGEDGELLPGSIPLQDPTSENCSQCHGLVHVDAQTPLALEGCTPAQWSTITTGQIVSPQRLLNSGMNLADKETLDRTWDVHAERVIDCTDCHYALNNPVYYQEFDETRPDHLIFDPRRIDLGEYLVRPLHQFAKGSSAQGTVAQELDNTLRRCESCHSIEATHDWLPYKEQHTTALSCESCHIPKMYSSARESIDWTVLQLDSTPQSNCRGVEGDGENFTNLLITGYEPVLLPRDNGDGTSALTPYNLVSSWYWVYGEPERPVPLRDLEAAWMDGDNYHTDILDTFDHNGDGTLDDSELIIDNDQKEALIAGKLAALGLENPRIAGEIQPYSINHDVTHGEWVNKDCQNCHSDESRITQPIQLSGNTPGGVLPTFVSDSNTALIGDLYTGDNGGLYYRTETSADSMYVIGHDSVYWIDLFGAIMFLGTIVGVAVHGGLRYFAARRRPAHEPKLKRLYMYTVYERLWHWLQTVAILILVFTGLIIHKPDMFGVFSFRYMVQVHNILAAILVINAALAAFYHFASGEIKQFLPEPRGFFSQAIMQTKFYLGGIFRGDEHPFEKTQQRKMNPLQQVTYVGILNVLLPLQIITGALMWGMQRWPETAVSLGGLPFLAPFHTLIAWSFASFIVMHVYLTTTGHTATAGIKSMIMGWDDVEVHTHPAD